MNYLHAKFQINIFRNKKVIKLLELWTLWKKEKRKKKKRKKKIAKQDCFTTIKIAHTRVFYNTKKIAHTRVFYNTKNGEKRKIEKSGVFYNN